MRIKILITLSALALLGALGCNKSPDDLKKEGVNIANAKGNSAIQTASYSTPCSSESYDFAGVTFPGHRIVYDLSDLNFTKKKLYYTDDCKTLAFFVEEKGKVNVIGKSGNEPNALEEDFNFESTRVLIANNLYLKAFNIAKACGFDDWTLNVPKDVSAEAAQALCPGEPSPRTSQELVLIEGPSMYLGGNTEQQGVGNRPPQVNRNLVFVKQ